MNEEIPVKELNYAETIELEKSIKAKDLAQALYKDFVDLASFKMNRYYKEDNWFHVFGEMTEETGKMDVYCHFVSIVNQTFIFKSAHYVSDEFLGNRNIKSETNYQVAHSMVITPAGIFREVKDKSVVGAFFQAYIESLKTPTMSDITEKDVFFDGNIQGPGLGMTMTTPRGTLIKRFGAGESDD